MNGGKFENGCKGAVWINGRPSRDYCLNTGLSKGRFPWWEHCCKWEKDECLPNKGKFNLYMVNFFDAS